MILAAWGPRRGQNAAKMSLTRANENVQVAPTGANVKRSQISVAPTGANEGKCRQPGGETA